MSFAQKFTKGTTFLLFILTCLSAPIRAAEGTHKTFFSNPIKTKDGFSIIVDKRDMGVSKVISETGMWERITGEVLLEIIKPDSKIVHLGAHIGYFDVFIGKRLSDKGALYVYEPSPEMYAILIENLKMNKLLGKVHPRRKAVSSEKGKTKLVYSLENTGGATIASGLGVHEKEFEVDIVTLDDEFPHLNDLTLIFMDIEGFEYEALKGGMKLIERNPQAYILMEFSHRMFERANSNVNDFIDFVKRKYNIFELDEVFQPISAEQLITTKKDLVNILLVPKTSNISFDYDAIHYGRPYDALLSDGFEFSKWGHPFGIKRIKGLSTPEKWGRWSDAQLDKIVTITMADPLPNKFLLKLEGIAFGDNVGKKMPIKIGTKTYEIILKAQYNESIMVQLDGAKASTITFTPPRPQLAGNGDTRKLAIGFKRLSITEQK